VFDDGVPERTVAGRPRVGGTNGFLLSGEKLREAAAVGEDALMGQVGQQAHAVGEADRAVQGDGFPDAADVTVRDPVLG
jgi:hypothetical protein